MKYQVADFDLTHVDTSRFDMGDVRVVPTSFLYLKEWGAQPFLSEKEGFDPEVLANPEEWEIVSEINDDSVEICPHEGKLEYYYESHYLVAKLAETERPEFFEFEDRAAELGFEEYA